MRYILYFSVSGLILLSIKNDLSAQKIKKDSTRVLNDFSYAVRSHKNMNYDSAVFFYQRALTKFLQSNSIREVINCYNSIGNTYYYWEKYDSAIHYINKAIDLTRKNFGENDTLIAESCILLGGVCSDQGDLNKSFEYYSKSLELYLKMFGPINSNISLVYTNLGIFYQHYFGNYEKALEYYQKSLFIKEQLSPEAINTAWDYNTIGTIYNELGETEKALEHYKRSLEIMKQYHKKHNSDIGYILNNIGKTYIAIGDNILGLEYLNQAIDNYTNSDKRISIELADIYVTLGGVHSERREEQKNINYQLKALDLYKTLFGEMNYYNFYCYSAIADGYYKLKRYDQSLDYLTKAKVILMNISKSHPDIMEVDKQIGNSYMAMGYKKKAKKAFKKALSLSKKELNTQYISSLSAHSSFALYYFTNQSYAIGLNYIQKGLIGYIPNFKDASVFVNPDIEQISPEPELISILILKAELSERIYFKNGDIRYLDLSLNTCWLLTELVDKFRYGYKAEETRFELSEKSVRIYENGIRVATELYTITGNSDYAKIAFLIAEKSKSRALLIAVSASKPLAFSGVPDSLLQLEKQLKKKIEFYEGHITEETSKGNEADTNKIIYWNNKLIEISTKFDTLNYYFETDYQAYFNLKYNSNPIGMEGIQKQLLDSLNHTALIEYFIGDSTLYSFLILSDTFMVMRKKLPSKFNELISAYRKSLIKKNQNQYIKNSLTLSNLLLDTLLGNLKSINKQTATRTDKLIIITGGSLSFLPFETLFTTSVDTSVHAGYDHLPFLIKNFEIAYYPSSNLLLETKQRSLFSEKKIKSFFAFAPVFKPEMNAVWNGQKVTELPSSETEVSTISSYFNNLTQDVSFTKTLINQNATEDSFKTLSPNKFSFIHLATHSNINEEHPDRSAIFFSQNNLKTENGFLYSGEVYNLQLNTQLLVLSGCETGSGKMLRGGGLMGLTRGFIYAGVNNMVVSLWLVNDISTTNLMKEFYRNIVLENRSFSTALRLSKLEMIKDPIYSFPYYWAPFLLTGFE